MHVSKFSIWASVILLFLTGLGTVSFILIEQSFVKDSQSYALDQLQTNKHVLSEKARSEWFFQLLRDPATDEIPASIRKRELDHAKLMPASSRSSQIILGKHRTRSGVNWFEAGPTNIGGRTRAFAVDKANSNHLLAGGVSGGVWSSDDAGESWRLVSDASQTPGVTSIVQDPRVGQENVWYHSTGEYLGNSASDRGRRAFYYGNGLYKSVDNGESWQHIESTSAGSSVAFDSPFDVVNRLAIHPQSGNLIVATNGFGMYQSADGGATFSPFASLNTGVQPVFTDVAVHDNGRIVIAISSETVGVETVETSGIFVSDDQGYSWADITPSTFPNRHLRDVIAIAPSNPDIVYIFTRTIFNLPSGEEDNRFHKIDLATGLSEDRTLTTPWDGTRTGYPATQNGYNMALAVKPDDENFVLLGGITLFRSRDGFSTLKTDWIDFWVGGYAPWGGLYPNQHPDQHLLVFDPNDSENLWASHDGGISLSGAISADTVKWTLKNNDYRISQYYTVHLPDSAGDTRLIGGTQDNGTTFMRWNEATPQAAEIVLDGDGSYAYWGKNYLYVSFQGARIYKMPYDSTDTPSRSELTNVGAVTNSPLFIHPFVIDPNNEEVLILPSANSLIRTKRASAPGVEPKWTRMLNNSNLGAHLISALVFTESVPENRLYVAASSASEKPRVYSIDNAGLSIGAEKELDLPDDIAAGGYVHSITANPVNGEEVMFALSNYNVDGIFHSSDGFTFESVEGNLKGDETTPGPSIRSVSIMPTESGETYYIAGTSTGVYVTNMLDGDNTIWVHEAIESIGTAVVESVDSRWQDGTIAVATHGRGLYIGQLQQFDGEEAASFFRLAASYPNPAAGQTTLPFTLEQGSNITLSIYDVAGRRIKTVVENRAYDVGTHQLNISTAGLANGTYLCRLEASPAYDKLSWFKTQVIQVIQ